MAEEALRYFTIGLGLALIGLATWAALGAPGITPPSGAPPSGGAGAPSEGGGAPTPEKKEITITSVEVS
jgi:hypothetical protein